MLTKLLIVAVLMLIIFNLFRALAALMNKDPAQSHKVVRALTIRVALSVGLFIALLVSSYLGLIPSHGLR
jgi:Flp pilus assembly protein protease CpaA